MKKFIYIIIPILLITGLAFVAAQCSERMMNTSEIESLIKQRLVVGDSVETVESFLRAQDWDYKYDKDLKRFQARNMKEDELPDLVGRNIIYIYMNEEHKFKYVEVMRVFP